MINVNFFYHKTHLTFPTTTKQGTQMTKFFWAWTYIRELDYGKALLVDYKQKFPLLWDGSRYQIG